MIITLLPAWHQSLAVKNGRNCPPQLPGVWPSRLEKGTNGLMPLTLDFSNMFDSDPQETVWIAVHHTHIHTKEFLPLPHDIHIVYILYVLYSSILFYYIFKMLYSHDQVDFKTSNRSWTIVWKTLSWTISKIH